MKFTQIVSSAGWLKNPFPFYIYPIIPARIPSELYYPIIPTVQGGVAHRGTLVSLPMCISPETS